MSTWSNIPTDLRKTDVTGRLTFTERVINFNQDDIQLRRGSDNHLYDLNRNNVSIRNLGSNRYDVTVTFGDITGFGEQSDTFYLRLKQRSVRFLRNLSYTPPNNVDSAGFSVDTFPPISVTLEFATTTGLVTGGTTTLNITTNRDVDLQLSYFSTDLGTLMNLRGSAQAWQVDLQLPAVGQAGGTATVTLAANSFFDNPEVTASISFGATPTIQSLDVQNILVNTEDYELVINTMFVEEGYQIIAKGDWDAGFYYEWDADNEQIKVKNPLVDRLETQKNWNFFIMSGDDVLADTSILYNVVPDPPVIALIERQTIHKGGEFDIFIPVSGQPAEVRMRGELIGAKSVATSEGGVNAIGFLPADIDLTVSEIDVPLYVANNVGSHQRDIPFAISDDPPVPPTDVPGSLSNVNASAQGNAIRFSWGAPVDDGGLAVLGYEVKIGNNEWIPKGLTRSHLFVGLTAGQTYTLYGRSRNADGYSAEVSRTITIPGQVPDDISVLFSPLSTYSGGSLVSYSLSKQVSWGAVSGATGYQIKYNSGQWITISRGRSHSSSLVHYPGSETISVRARNDNGYGPARTYSYSGATNAPYLSISQDDLTLANGQITVSWGSLPSVPSGFRYQRTIVSDGNNSYNVDAPATSYVITGLTNGNAYSIRLNSVMISTDGRVRILADAGEVSRNGQDIALFNKPTITSHSTGSSGESLTWSYTPLGSEVPPNFQTGVDDGHDQGVSDVSSWYDHGPHFQGIAAFSTDTYRRWTIFLRAATAFSSSGGVGGPVTKINVTAR